MAVKSKHRARSHRCKSRNYRRKNRSTRKSSRRHYRKIHGGNYSTDMTTRTTEGVATKPLHKITVDIKPDGQLPGYQIYATVKTKAETGVEMEALTAVSVAALTLYDMAKALEKSIQIESISLVSKTGGKSGNYQHF